MARRKTHGGQRVRRTLSDVSVLANAAPRDRAPEERASVSINVREIDNGFIVTETRCGTRGTNYETRERFMREKPVLPSLGSIFEKDVGRD